MNLLKMFGLESPNFIDSCIKGPDDPDFSYGFIIQVFWSRRG